MSSVGDDEMYESAMEHPMYLYDPEEIPDAEEVAEIANRSPSALEAYLNTARDLNEYRYVVKTVRKNFFERIEQKLNQIQECETRKAEMANRIADLEKAIATHVEKIANLTKETEKKDYGNALRAFVYFSFFTYLFQSLWSPLQ